MKKILELLGLTPEATAEDAAAAIGLLQRQAEATSGAPKKIIKALGLENPSDADILEAILALKKNAKAVIELSEFDKKVQARMIKGRISKEAATLAQRHQEETDKLIAKRDKSAKK